MDDLPAAVIELLSITGNDTCMECDSNAVEWASINLGVFLCESCGGRHRQLGVHISRVQSLAHDTKVWTLPSTIQDMKAKGNINAKYYFESRVPMYQVKPPRDIGPVVVEDWIRNKYEKQLFIDPNNANNIYYHSAQRQRQKHIHNVNGTNDERKSNSPHLNFALHKMPCSPTYCMTKWIVENDKNDTDKYQTKQQFIVLHGRFLSRYASPSSHKCEQIIDITKYKVYIALSDLNRPCILALEVYKNKKNIDRNMRFEFAYYKDIKYWTELIRKSALFYAELGRESCAMQANDTINSLLLCSVIDIGNADIYKHLKYGSIKKRFGWDKKWFVINLRRKILIYFHKNPADIKPNKKNPLFIEAQGGFYMNEIIADIDNNAYRSGNAHCLLLYHFNRTIFIKFEERWPLIQFWKELHLKGRDVKYIGHKVVYYELALCQQNLDVQVMVLKNSIKLQQKNSKNKSDSLAVAVHKHSEIKNNKQTITDMDMAELQMDSATLSLHSPPLPPDYNGPLTINGVDFKIDSAILRHEKVTNDSITDFNQSDSLHIHNVSRPNLHRYPRSSLRMLMDLQHGTNDTIQNDINLSDDEEEDPFDIESDEDVDAMNNRGRKQTLTVNRKRPKVSMSNSGISDSFNVDFGVFDNDEMDVQQTTYNHVNSHNNNNNDAPHLSTINTIETQKRSPIVIKQSVSGTVSDNENDTVSDINEHIVGRLRDAVGSMEELQYLADNTPYLPDEDNNSNESTEIMRTDTGNYNASTAEDMTLTDPPSELFKQLTNHSDYTHTPQPELLETISDCVSDVSEEEDVMYKDHRRGTVEKYAERNKYKSRTYRNFAKIKNGDKKINSKVEDNEMKSCNGSEKQKKLQPQASKVKLPAPPPKRKRKGNELMRQYQLNATQIRKLNDSDMMQEIMIQAGSMASFFVQPGNKLFVHLHGTAQNAANSTHTTLQVWQYVEELLSERIGQLQLIPQN